MTKIKSLFCTHSWVKERIYPKDNRGRFAKSYLQIRCTKCNKVKK